MNIKINFSKLLNVKILFNSLFFILLFSSSMLAQENIKKEKERQNKIIKSSLAPNSPQAIGDKVSIKDEDGNTLIEVNDEGTFGSITLPDSTAAPSNVANKLYNVGGTLNFNGSAIGAGGATEINDLTDGKSDGVSLFLGNGSGANDDAGASDGNKNFNTAVGTYALNKNTTGISNTAIGYLALQLNTTGNYNTAIGFSALKANETGITNTAIGSYALSANEIGHHSTAIGSYALFKNTNGHSNTAIGYEALYSNISGYSNTAIGNDALHHSTGSFNTAIGFNSLRANTLGNNNVCIGYESNSQNEEGSNNTIIGYYAGSGASLHNKSGNIFIGYQAGMFETGDNKLYIENSDASNPLIWGDFTDGSEKVKINGDFKVKGSTMLGTTTSVTGNNSTAIGSKVSVTGNGTIFVGDSSTTTTHTASANNRFAARFANGYKFFTDSGLSIGAALLGGANSWSVISDSTKKENFKLVNGEKVLNKIAQFKLTSWNYKTQDPAKFRHYGPMAQDFYSAFGNDGIGIVGNDTTIASSDFAGISFIAIQALEKRTAEQKVQIKTLLAENAKLKTVIAENKNLRNEINIIKTALNKLMQKPEIKVSSK